VHISLIDIIISIALKFPWFQLESTILAILQIRARMKFHTVVSFNKLQTIYKHWIHFIYKHIYELKYYNTGLKHKLNYDRMIMILFIS